MIDGGILHLLIMVEEKRKKKPSHINFHFREVFRRLCSFLKVLLKPKHDGNDAKRFLTVSIGRNTCVRTLVKVNISYYLLLIME